MPLYTFILDFRGGTYVLQVTAATPRRACVAWARKLDTSQVFGLGHKGKESLIEQMKEDGPVAISEVKNVWCKSALVRGKLAIITLVQTDAA